jgi:predicted N-acetyltransferase YhbS
VPYRELRSKEELLPLMDHAFRWPFTSKSFEALTKHDSRLANSEIGFCALENRHVVGFVGLLELTTLTAAGKTENLGGIYGVATLPSHTRRGISTKLFRVVHDSFLGKGYRFSVLGTSRSLVSHAFYEKLGYADQVEIPTAYRILKTRKILAPTSVRFDYGMLLSIYRRYLKGKTGFVCRHKSYLRFFESIQ